MLVWSWLFPAKTLKISYIWPTMTLQLWWHLCLFSVPYPTPDYIKWPQLILPTQHPSCEIGRKKLKFPINVLPPESELLFEAPTSTWKSVLLKFKFATFVRMIVEDTFINTVEYDCERIESAVPFKMPQFINSGLRPSGAFYVCAECPMAIQVDFWQGEKWIQLMGNETTLVKC